MYKLKQPTIQYSVKNHSEVLESAGWTNELALTWHIQPNPNKKICMQTGMKRKKL